MKLTSENVSAVFGKCLFTDEEAKAIDRKDTSSFVAVRGIVTNFGFHPVRLHDNKKDICDMLLQLPAPFMKTSGGGWTFLNACDDKDGNQWTDLHAVMEQLFCMGIGLGVCGYGMPRDFWSALPGGMPYISVDDEKCKEA